MIYDEERIGNAMFPTVESSCICQECLRSQSRLAGLKATALEEDVVVARLSRFHRAMQFVIALAGD